MLSVMGLRPCRDTQKALGVTVQDVLGDLAGQPQTADEGDLGGGIRPGGIRGEEDAGGVVLS